MTAEYLEIQQMTHFMILLIAKNLPGLHLSPLTGVLFRYSQTMLFFLLFLHDFGMKSSFTRQ